jgi:hypothetical protein
MRRPRAADGRPLGVNRAPWFAIWLILSAGVLLLVTFVLSRKTGASDNAAGHVLTAGNATITVTSRGTTPDVGQASVDEWVVRSAAIVRGYFGEFPVPAVTLRITTADGGAMGSGKTYGYPQPRIEVTMGQHISLAALSDDWVLVHEMTHLSLPAIADEHNWLAEGVAVYVEGIARTQAGNLTEARLWEEYATSMPKGLPQPGDQGLDRTHTWARTYWGGALYCLIADVQIREKTKNRRGLQDALRAIARAAGGMSQEWPIERVLRIGDAATGTTVLTDVYVAMKDHPYAPDLLMLWSDLGLRLGEGGMRFDETARLAAVRRAIARAPSAGRAGDAHVDAAAELPETPVR